MHACRWLGWPDNMQAAVALYSELIKNAGAGLVRGLATDVANYTPVVEPFLNATNQAVYSGSFYEWNPAFDESTYVKLLNEKFSAAGLPGLGFIMCDTFQPTPLDLGIYKYKPNFCNTCTYSGYNRQVTPPIPSLQVTHIRHIACRLSSQANSKQATLYLSDCTCLVLTG